MEENRCKSCRWSILTKEDGLLPGVVVRCICPYIRELMFDRDGKPQCRAFEQGRGLTKIGK